MSSQRGHKTAVVTGGGRGLGAAIVKRLAADGFRVLATDVDPGRIEKCVANAGGDAGQVRGLKLDVTRIDDFQAALECAVDTWGGVGVLVNNAALTRTTSIFDISPEEFSSVVDVNLRGTFLGCQVFGKYFQDWNYGRIINMASLAAQNGGAATGAHYAASKGGIVTLTKVFARDLAASGVTVNAISPGPLDVDLVHEILPPEKLAKVVDSIPVGTLGDPEFIAELVLMLASKKAAAMTGATIDVNGGLYVR